MGAQLARSACCRQTVPEPCLGVPNKAQSKVLMSWQGDWFFCIPGPPAAARAVFPSIGWQCIPLVAVGRASIEELGENPSSLEAAQLEAPSGTVVLRLPGHAVPCSGLMGNSR